MPAKASRVLSYLFTARFTIKQKGNFCKAQKLVTWDGVAMTYLMLDPYFGYHI